MPITNNAISKMNRIRFFTHFMHAVYRLSKILTKSWRHFGTNANQVALATESVSNVQTLSSCHYLWKATDFWSAIHIFWMRKLFRERNQSKTKATCGARSGCCVNLWAVRRASCIWTSLKAIQNFKLSIAAALMMYSSSAALLCLICHDEVQRNTSSLG